jgi:hypothetical protein
MRTRAQSPCATTDHASQAPDPVGVATTPLSDLAGKYFGNQAALRRLSRMPRLTHSRLEIGAAHDPLEAEADRAADHVMRMPDPAPRPLGHGDSAIVRRKCACEDSGEPCSSCAAEKKEALMRSPSGENTPGHAPPVVHDVLRSPGQPLDASTRTFFEPRFGRDLGGVRVHNDNMAAQSAQSVDALAYTVGSHIVFGQDRWQPASASGRHLLAHELAHTVQNSSSGAVLRPQRAASAGDSSELAADQAADASLTAAPGLALRRQQAPRTCTATAPTADDPTHSPVHCSDGSDYRVAVTLTPNPPSPDTKTKVNAGFGDNILYVTIDVCHGGTEITITPNSGDLSPAVAKAVANIIAASPVLSGVTATPGLKITVVQSQSFTLTLEPTVTVDQTGVTGGGASVTVETEKGSVSLGGTYSAPTKAFNFTLTFTPGKPQKKFACTKDSNPTVVFSCEQITHKPGEKEVPELTTTDPEVRYIFFEYPTAKIRQNFRLPAPDDMQKLATDGYKVVSIDGYTSPEGPRGQQHMPVFEGNDVLGQERATAAHDWLAKTYPQFDLTGAPVTGHSELPPELSKGPDVEGKAMERAAVSEFLGDTPGTTADPLAPKDPADQAAFRARPQSKQRNQAFELMRRAEIRFERKRITQQHKDAVPAKDESKEVGCDKDVTDAARQAFGINILTAGPATK